MGRYISRFLVATFLLTSCVLAASQDPPAANPKDVESIDSIMKAVYEVISGPAGQARDWDRFRSLFIPEARLIPSSPSKEGEGMVYRVLTPEEYVTRSGPYLEKQGFFEQEIYRSVEQFGSVAHGFSTYESRHSLEDAEPFARGINSFQLHFDGKRWWVVTIFWTGERPDLAIPAKYLP